MDMIKEKELQKRLQEESYKIICESISEEERTAMNLTAEQIIPTIKLFRMIQYKLFEIYCCSMWRKDLDEVGFEYYLTKKETQKNKEKAQVSPCSCYYCIAAGAYGCFFACVSVCCVQGEELFRYG